MKGSFAPIALNTPSIEYTDTSTSKTSYTFYINVSNMQSGDEIEISLKTDTTTTVGTVIFDTINYTDIVNQSILVSIPIIQESGDTFSVTLEQTSGTVRTYEWSVINVQYQ
jgi:hypothetical protein